MASPVHGRFSFLSAFPFLRRWLGREEAAERLRQQRPLRRTRRDLGFEQLERRDLLSVGVNFSGGLLTLTGTAVNEDVAVVASSTKKQETECPHSFAFTEFGQLAHNLAPRLA